MRTRHWVAIGVLIIIAWALTITVDYIHVFKNYEKPLFARQISSANYGNELKYESFGYGFEIKGDFLPKAKIPGVHQAKMYIFGNEVKYIVRGVME